MAKQFTKTDDILHKLTKVSINTPINGYEDGVFLQESKDYVRELDLALRQAISVIKQWHNAKDVWDIYINNAPEMRIIKEFYEKYNK